MNAGIQIRFLVGEMTRQCKEYLILGIDPDSKEKAAAIKEEIIRLHIGISSLIKIRSDLSESRKEKMC